MIDLKHLQEEVVANKKRHNFNTTDINTEFLLTFGEVSEAYEAYRLGKEDIGEELADIMIFTMGIAELLHINLEEEVPKKMEKNSHRQSAIVNGVAVHIN